MPKLSIPEQAYFTFGIKELPTERTLPCGLYLYFRQNEHMMIWKHSGDDVSRHQIQSLETKGVATVWIQNSDRAVFIDFLKPQKPATILGAIAQKVLGSEDLSEKEKRVAISNIARSTLEALAEVKPKSQEALNAKALVLDVLQTTPKELRSKIQELWKLTQVDPDLEHGANVATFSVLLSMAFGRIDAVLLGELALAGLLHDLGHCQTPYTIRQKSWNEFSLTESQSYVRHVQNSLTLIRTLAPDISDRVLEIIHQHHERFNGRGYPRHLQGFEISDIAQLLGVSDLLENFCNGTFDGVARTLSEGLLALEKIEKSKNFPEYFNPEIFSLLLAFTGKKAKDGLSKSALLTLTQQLGSVLTLDDPASVA